MNTETVIKDLEHCLNADCQECGHAQTASKLTCGKLLKSVLVKVRQLAAYEQLLKQGRMVKLPCALKDKIYWISDEDGEGNKVKTVKTERVDFIVISRDGFYTACTDDLLDYCDKIGSRWALLTKGQAEKMAGEMNAGIYESSGKVSGK